MKYLLNTFYKGSRHYIHGSDLFNNITTKLLSSSKYQQFHISQLIFTRFAYHLCELTIEGSSESKNIIGKGIINLNEDKKKFHLTETKQAPSSRYPFDENNLVAQADFKAKSIFLNQPKDYTSIETVIALTKALSYKLMPLDEGKWVFGRIDLNTSLPIINQSVSIHQINAIQGRFSLNNIEIDGRPVGKIQFIKGNP